MSVIVLSIMETQHQNSEEREWWSKHVKTGLRTKVRRVGVQIGVQIGIRSDWSMEAESCVGEISNVFERCCFAVKFTDAGEVFVFVERSKGEASTSASGESQEDIVLSFKVRDTGTYCLKKVLISLSRVSGF